VSLTERYATGDGPGAITPDGCGVDFYSLLPPGEAEADIVMSVAPAGGAVLELGAGAGRVTHCLVDRGLTVVAVDESREMLAHIHGAETVLSTIEDLELNRRFDVVVLGSHLVNAPDDHAARLFLAVCARHVADDGCVLIERRDAEWFDTAQDSTVERDGIVFTLGNVVRRSADILTATVTYDVGARRWTQTFTTGRVDDDRLERLLGDVGLLLVGFADDLRRWAIARPSSRP
jgi:SAM-dependent methyltransferase